GPGLFRGGPGSVAGRRRLGDPVRIDRVRTGWGAGSRRLGGGRAPAQSLVAGRLVGTGARGQRRAVPAAHGWNRRTVGTGAAAHGPSGAQSERHTCSIVVSNTSIRYRKDQNTEQRGASGRTRLVFCPLRAKPILS